VEQRFEEFFSVTEEFLKIDYDTFFKVLRSAWRGRKKGQINKYSWGQHFCQNFQLSFALNLSDVQ
jgi:hypothetical protein